jgi:hypothetical protein
MLTYFFYFQVKTCPSSDVPFATESPASAFVNYNTAVTYTCDTGYEVTSGDTVRTCEASSVLSGTLPVCSSMFYSTS